MAKWYHIPTTFRMTDDEYAANINGINMVFGAVLGFVLARAEEMPTDDFAFVLLLSAGVVVTILYLASSEYRLFYAGTAALAIAFLPEFLAHMNIGQIPKLQPTLAVWAAMVVFLELFPRYPNPSANTGDKT